MPQEIHKLLGLRKTASMSDVTSSYRKAVQKYRPERFEGTEKISGHLGLVELNLSYLDWKTKASRQKAKLKHTDHEQARGEVEGDYTLYKQGYTLFTLAWSASWNSQISKRKTDLELLETDFQRELFENFPGAYYYFSLLIERYPESKYASDSREKMARIEKLTPIYEKILRRSALSETE